MAAIHLSVTLLQDSHRTSYVGAHHVRVELWPQVYYSMATYRVIIMYIEHSKYRRDPHGSPSSLTMLGTYYGSPSSLATLGLQWNQVWVMLL